MVTTQMTALQCAQEIMETMPMVMRFLRAEMYRQGALALSIPQYRVLSFLDLNPGTSLSDVAGHIGVTKATASALIERLVKRGLITRQDDPLERRRVSLTLTTAGFAQLKQARVRAQTVVAAILEDMPSANLCKIAEGTALLSKAVKGATQNAR